MFNPGATFAVHFSGLNDTIRNSQYGAMKVKDAIVDAFTRKNLPRPNVDRDAPISALTSGCIKKPPISPLISVVMACICVAIDAGIAPIKETLAAAIVMRFGWQPGTPPLGSNVWFWYVAD